MMRESQRKEISGIQKREECFVCRIITKKLCHKLYQCKFESAMIVELGRALDVTH